MLGTETSAATESCSIYTTDSDTINEFHTQAALQSTGWLCATSAPVDSPVQDQTALSQSQGVTDSSTSSFAPAESVPWDVEWGDGPLAGEVSDPFFADWPKWSNQTDGFKDS